MSLAFVVLVLLRDVILRNLPSPYFPLLRARCVFNATDDFGFIVLAFLEQLFNALGVGARSPRQALKVAGLSSRSGSRSAPGPLRPSHGDPAA
jgi:hypothetical protein